MSADIPTDDLAVRLELAIREVPGVSAVYTAAPLVTRALRGLGNADDRPSLVHVEAGEGAVEVTTVIGVDPEASAPTVADAVAAAVRAIAGESARVTVRVGRVAP